MTPQSAHCSVEHRLTLRAKGANRHNCRRIAGYWRLGMASWAAYGGLRGGTSWLAAALARLMLASRFRGQVPSPSACVVPAAHPSPRRLPPTTTIPDPGADHDNSEIRPARRSISAAISWGGSATRHQRLRPRLRTNPGGGGASEAPRIHATAPGASSTGSRHGPTPRRLRRRQAQHLWRRRRLRRAHAPASTSDSRSTRATPRRRAAGVPDPRRST